MSESPATRRGVILVVDDDARIATLWEILLSRRGHTVMTAGTLAEACATCELHAPDVIILDMFLPDGSGVDLMVPVRRISPNARIIAITGGETWEGFELLTRAKDAGADVSLRKPVPAEVLVEAVERLLP